MSVRNCYRNIRDATASIRMRISWIWTAALCLIRILSRISISICSAASTISAICLSSATIWQRRWAASVRNTTERRIMTLFSVVRRRRRRFAISRRCCITGAATRIRQRATRRASCTHLMRVRARSWIIINASVSRRSAWKKVWTTAFITLYIKFRGNRWYRSSFRTRITIRIWIYACGRLRRGQRTAMLSLSL